MSKGDMSISAFSRRSLLSVKALRLYDEMGLLRPQHVDPVSKYRYYSESQLETARLISLLRKLEVPLAQIAQILAGEPGEASPALADWWGHETARMAMRADLLQYIRGSVLGDAHVDGSTTAIAPTEMREVPAQTNLVITRHLHGPELPGFIAEATEMLFARSTSYGGATGPMAVMFHGQVDLDSDGPADVCLPIATRSVAEGEDNLRTESAHFQAFTVLRKYQLAFPQVLQVYQGLRRWIDAHGYAISGLPREIYIANYETAGPHDPVCEVAYPIQPTKGTHP